MYDQARMPNAAGTLDCEEHFGVNCQVFGENSGIYVLARFATKMTDQEIIDAALNKGVCVVPAVHLNKPSSGELVLCHGGVKEDDIKRGVKLLSEAIRIDH